VDGILVAEPIRTLDGIVHMPSPVVLVHITQCGIDATLGGDGMTSGREELRYTGRVEASLCKTEGSSQTGAARTDDDSIVLVVLTEVNWHALEKSKNL
jgi:hypothetical protein